MYGFYDVVWNELGYKGCRYFPKADWNKLQYLNLGKFSDTKPTTILAKKGANILAKVIGLT